MKNLAGIATTQIEDYKNIFNEYSEGEYISKKVYNNGDFDYQHCIEIIENPDEPENMIIFWGVAKTQDFLTKDQIKSVRTGLCIDKCTTFDIYQYGMHADIDSVNIHNSKPQETLNAIAARVEAVNELFGFYMDKPLNRLGNTGWDFINGKV